MDLSDIIKELAALNSKMDRLAADYKVLAAKVTDDLYAIARWPQKLEIRNEH